MTNMFPYLHFTVAVIYLIFTVFILWRNPRNALNQWFALLFGLLAVWSFSYMFVHNTETSQNAASIAMSIAAIGWIGTINVMLWLSVILTERPVKFWMYIITLVPTVIFLYWEWTGKLITGFEAKYYGWGFIFGFANMEFYLWIACYFFIVALSLYYLFKEILTRKKDVKKKQIEIIFLASIVFLFLSALTDIFLPLMGIYLIPDIANVIAIAWLLGVIYAINKYDFLSITPMTAAESILSTMSDALFLLDLDGKVIIANKALLDMTGYKNKELGKKKIGDILEKNLADKVIDKAIQEKKFSNYDSSLKTKTGGKIPVFFSSSNLQSKNGDLIGVVGIARDITNLKKRKEELKEKGFELKKKINKLNLSKKKNSEVLEELSQEKKKVDAEREKVNSIISSFSDPIIFIDHESKIKLINETARKNLGMYKKNLGTEISPENDYGLDNFREVIKRDFEVNKVDEDGEAFEEISFEHKGVEYFYKVFTNKVYKDGEYYGSVKFFHDIAREKAIEKMKSQFISIAAHQLRTPLSAIKWGIRMVLDGDVGEINRNQRELLEKGHENNERVIILVNDLLKVSRIEEDRMSFDFEKENLGDLLEEVLEEKKGEIKAKKIDLAVDKRKKDFYIKMDKVKIKTVMESLLDNAIKYTPDNGSIKIKMEEKDSSVSLKIRDNGVGIPEADQEKIFSKFFRGGNVVRIQTGGSGLGLFIVKNIIKKHDGDIKINSKEGRGTEVEISFPQA